jgi:F-type H+-transporting ATPase subunit delta
MQASEISSRYAKALFSVATEKDNRQKVFDDLKALKSVVDKDKQIKDFLSSQAVSVEDKKKVLAATFEKVGLQEEVKNFVLLLAEKNRLSILDSIVVAYEQTSDDAHGVTRGKVKSAKPLSEEDQRSIEDKINKVTGKKVILNYECDPSVIGGLIAEVGGYVFDDTIITHLRRLKDEIKRRSH